MLRLMKKSGAAASWRGAAALPVILLVLAGCGSKPGVDDGPRADAVDSPQQLVRTAGELQFSGRFLSPSLDRTARQPVRITALTAGEGSDGNGRDADLQWKVSSDNGTVTLTSARVGRFRVEWYDEIGNSAFAHAVVDRSGAITIAPGEFWPGQNRVRLIRSQQDLDSLTGYNAAAGAWPAGSRINLLSKDIRDWKAADTGLPFDGIVVAAGVSVRLFLPGELIPGFPGMGPADANTFYVPAGKFLKIRNGGRLQIWSGMNPDDFDSTTLIAGGTGTSNPAVSPAPAGNTSTAASLLNYGFAHAIEIEERGVLVIGSDSASAIDRTGGSSGKPDNATLVLADGKSLDAGGRPSPYAGSILVDGELHISCAAGAGVAKIWAVDNLTGNGSTLAGTGKLLIRGLHPVHGTALFAINEFDRGALSNGMDYRDVPSITLGAIEIIGEGTEGIYNPDGSVDGSPGYRNNANAGFYYVAGEGTIRVGRMIVRSNNTGVTADTTVALANFHTAAGILGGVVTDHGPVVELGEVEIFNAAANDADGPLSAIYTVQGVITATVTGTVKVESPNGGAASIVSTGHGRWTGPEKTISRIGTVRVSAKGRNAFFQNNTFEGYGTQVSGDVIVSAFHDGTVARFVGRVPPGPDMGTGGTPGQAPEAEDTRDEQFVNQGGEVTVDGRVVVENKAPAPHYALVSTGSGAKTAVGSLAVNGTRIAASPNLESAGAGTAVRVVNEGSFAVGQR